MPKMITDIQANFWAKVAIKGPDECWEWQAHCKENGYGQFFVKRQPKYAHRFSYELAFGQIPFGMNVCHKCDNPRCVNPNHLELGSQADNMHDMLAKGRANLLGLKNIPTRYLKGSDNPSTKLTEEAVVEIRDAYTDKKISVKELAQKHNVTESAIYRILRKKNWQHI